MGMLVRRANAAAAIAETSSVVKSSMLSTDEYGASRTPASPAIVLESIQAAELARSAFTPASSVSRGLSTTARICRPIAVHRNIATSSSTASAVADEDRHLATIEHVVTEVVERVVVPPDARDAEGLAGPEPDLDDLGERDEQTERGHELADRRAASQPAEDEPVEDEPEER